VRNTTGGINCLDPGGFGTVTITKSITIDWHESFASSLGAGTNGVNIPRDRSPAQHHINGVDTAPPASISVRLRSEAETLARYGYGCMLMNRRPN
jgi:hypothetical protein